MLDSSAWIYFLSAVLARYVWRFAAVMISHRIEANHSILSGSPVWRMASLPPWWLVHLFFLQACWHYFRFGID